MTGALGSSGAKIRIEGRAGRITLDRPAALNALTHDMVTDIDAALRDWAGDHRVALVLIDAAGEKAFCAGGDIADLHATGMAGDFAYGRRFWRDEYRLNALLAGYGKPVVSLLQGYTMGGGVGVGCHGSDRVVCEDSRIAMPEVGIGLVPDVGGSLLLARAPGRLGTYLGLTAARMGPGDAILVGFADHFVPRADWPALAAALCETGDAALVRGAARPAPDAALAPQRDAIDACFTAPELAGIVASLRMRDDDWARATLDAMGRMSPLAMACAVELLARLRADPSADMAEALALEYRFTSRAMEQGDFLEGVRAAVIDKDRAPRWRHAAPDGVPAAEVAAMLAPLGENALILDGEPA
jgi:enoyl-CoA hydratase/carnithine racemase